jgi:uncharacterized protein
MEHNTITIEIAYAVSKRQQILEVLSIPAGYTIAQAITQSTLLTQFPDIDVTQNNVGIFGRKVALSYSLSAFDRIEIYRPLRIDPKQARRLRSKNPRQ